MPPDQPKFEHKLAAHLEYRNHLPRRFKAGKAADRLFLARVTADHDAAVAEVAETHLAASKADTRIIKGLRAEVERLRASLAKAEADHITLTTDHEHLQQRFGDLQAEAKRHTGAHETVVAGFRAELATVKRERDDALQVAAIRLTEAETAQRELAQARDHLKRLDADFAKRGRTLAETRAGLDQAKHDLADLEGRIATQVFVDGEPVGREPLPQRTVKGTAIADAAPGRAGRGAAAEPPAGSPATPATPRTRKPPAGAK